MGLISTWRSLPFILNVWFSLLRGVILLFLLQDEKSSAGVRLLVVEERLSLAVILLWFLSGGIAPVFLLLVIKSALAPFHAWLIKALALCKKETLVWALSAHKTPVVMFFLRLSSAPGLVLLLLSICRGTLFLFALGEVRRIVILSSRNVFASSILFFWFFGTEALLFFALYCLVLWRSLTRGTEFNSLLLFLGLIGIPPLLLFQFKWILLFSLIKETSGLALILIFFSAISVAVYARFCFFVDFKKEENRQAFLAAWALVRSSLLVA